MLFKQTLNAKNEEIQKYLPISQSLAFYKMKPGIETAERDYLTPVIGLETYTAIDEYYNQTGSGTPDDTDLWDKLVEHCQRAVINIAFFVSFDVINSVIDDSGFGRIESDKRKGLYKYSEDNIRKSFERNGFNAFDSILSFLHANIESFGVYKSSAEYTRYKTSFFRTVTEFDEVVYISKSNLTFRRLTQFITLAEDFELKKLLGATTWDYIKTEMAKDEPSAKALAIIPYIKRPLAYLSVAKLIEQTGADLTENGLYFTAWQATAGNQLNIQPSETDKIAALAKINRTTGENYMNELKQYLLAHTTDWPSFVSAPTYLINRSNANKKTFWT